MPATEDILYQKIHVIIISEQSPAPENASPDLDSRARLSLIADSSKAFFVKDGLTSFFLLNAWNCI
jgi:hypothetical protein